MDLHKEQNVQMVEKSSESTSRQRSRKNPTKKTTDEKDQKKHRLIPREKRLPHGLEVSYIHKKKTLLKGRTEGNGIRCACCNKVVSPTVFEDHAGRSSCKKPYQHIFLSNGVSLHQYASSLKLNNEKLVENNDVAGGSGSGINPIEEVLDRRVLVNPDKHNQIACVLCRSYDFHEGKSFNDQTSIVCDQCELEFHIGCLREHCIANLKQLPLDNWFCSVECGRLNYAIKVLVACGSQKVPDSFVTNITNLEVNLEWTIVRGNSCASEGNRLLLAEALGILHDRFNPIIDPITGGDFIKSMTYGQKLGGSNFEGVHCAMLTIKSKVVSVGLFRVLGHEMVELPIVATSQPYHGKGCFKLLFTYLEKLASFLKVKKLLVLAAEDAKAMWTDKFGFHKVTPLQLSEYRHKHTAMVNFNGTCLLEKEVRVGRITFEDEPFFNIDMV